MGEFLKQEIIEYLYTFICFTYNIFKSPTSYSFFCQHSLLELSIILKNDSLYPFRSMSIH